MRSRALYARFSGHPATRGVPVSLRHPFRGADAPLTVCRRSHLGSGATLYRTTAESRSISDLKASRSNCRTVRPLRCSPIRICSSKKNAGRRGRHSRSAWLPLAGICKRAKQVIAMARRPIPATPTGLLGPRHTRLTATEPRPIRATMLVLPLPHSRSPMNKISATYRQCNWAKPQGARTWLRL